jgi:SM-20-related protein
VDLAQIIPQNSSSTNSPFYVCYHQLFPESFVRDLRSRLFAAEDKFISIQYGANLRANSRNSARHCKVMFGLDIPELKAKIHELLPEVLAKLNLPSFNISRFEVQGTSYVQGGFFIRHQDTGDYPHMASLRTLSYVYYIHQEPRSFEGGELCIYAPGSGECIFKEMPPSNTIIFFPSAIEHEVLPLSSENTDIALGRCTVNGWLSRQDQLVQFGYKLRKRFPQITRPFKKPFVNFLRLIGPKAKNI